jgi:hypothetical protein
MTSKLNKKVMILIACLLLVAPVTVAQSQSPQARASVVCQGGRVVGVNAQVLKPGDYTFRFSDDACFSNQRKESVA